MAGVLLLGSHVRRSSMRLEKALCFALVGLGACGGRVDIGQPQPSPVNPIPGGNGPDGGGSPDPTGGGTTTTGGSVTTGGTSTSPDPARWMNQPPPDPIPLEPTRPFAQACEAALHGSWLSPDAGLSNGKIVDAKALIVGRWASCQTGTLLPTAH